MPRINSTLTQFRRDFWHALSDPRPKSLEISRGEHQKASGRRDLRSEILPILEGVETGLGLASMHEDRARQISFPLVSVENSRVKRERERERVRATKGNINPLKLQPRPSISRQLFSERSFLSPRFLWFSKTASSLFPFSNNSLAF